VISQSNYVGFTTFSWKHLYSKKPMIRRSMVCSNNALVTSSPNGLPNKPLRVLNTIIRESDQRWESQTTSFSGLPSWGRKMKDPGNEVESQAQR